MSRRGKARRGTFYRRALIGRGGASCGRRWRGAGAAAHLREQVTAGCWRWALREESGPATLGRRRRVSESSVTPRERLGPGLESEAVAAGRGPGPARPREPRPGLERAPPPRRDTAPGEWPFVSPLERWGWSGSGGLGEDQDLGRITIAVDCPPKAEVSSPLVSIP